jgi:hypothetical protein
MYVKVESFGVKSKSKQGFEKGDMHIVIIVESTTIVSSISSFHLELVPIVFDTNSIREFINFVQSWSFANIMVIITSVRGGGDNNGEKQLMIVDGKGKFDQNVLIKCQG